MKDLLGLLARNDIKLAIAMVALLIIGIYTSDLRKVQQDEAATDASSQNELRKQFLEMGRIERLVKAQLRDPDSAKFTHLGGGCGYVNSRNGFGGMSGDTPFIVGENDKVVFERDGPADFRTVWTGHCSKFGG